LKKSSNETQTESELQIEYQKRVMEGKLASMKREHKKMEREISDKIAQKKE
jgi:hypothetical protein